MAALLFPRRHHLPREISTGAPPALLAVPRRSSASAVVDASESGAEADSGSAASAATAGGSAAAGAGGNLPSSRYKGVVPQPNGRWDAQIYERHQHVWLGTFAGESDAARAYDVAAQCFRGRNAVTNFRPLATGDADPDAAAELEFLASSSKAEVVDMLRKHTYLDELAQNKRAFAAAATTSSLLAGAAHNSSSSSDAAGCKRAREMATAAPPQGRRARGGGAAARRGPRQSELPVGFGGGEVVPEIWGRRRRP